MRTSWDSPTSWPSGELGKNIIRTEKTRDSEWERTGNQWMVLELIRQLEKERQEGYDLCNHRSCQPHAGLLIKLGKIEFIYLVGPTIQLSSGNYS